MGLADFGLGTPDGRATGAGSFFFVAPTGPGGAAQVYRLNAATLMLDLKSRLGFEASTNTAYGPDTNARVRESSLRLGVAPGELPAPSAQWRAGRELSAGVLRLLAWLAYVEPQGVPLASVVLDRVAHPPKWGERIPGGRVAVQRDAIGTGGASVNVGTGGASVNVGGTSVSVGDGGSTSSNTTGGSTSSNTTGGLGEVVMPGAWHLRSSATSSNAGAPEFPAGERVVLLEVAPGMQRGPAERGYRVRVVRTGAEGFAFVPLSTLERAGVEVARGVGGVVGNAAASLVTTALKWSAVAVGVFVVGGAVTVGVLKVRESRAEPRGMGYRPAMPPPAPLPPTRPFAAPAEPPAGLVGPSPSRSTARGYGNPAARFRRVS